MVRDRYGGYREGGRKREIGRYLVKGCSGLTGSQESADIIWLHPRLLSTPQMV